MGDIIIDAVKQPDEDGHYDPIPNKVPAPEPPTVLSKPAPVNSPT